MITSLPSFPFFSPTLLMFPPFNLCPIPPTPSQINALFIVITSTIIIIAICLHKFMHTSIYYGLCANYCRVEHFVLDSHLGGSSFGEDSFLSQKSLFFQKTFSHSRCPGPPDLAISPSPLPGLHLSLSYRGFGCQCIR